MTVLKTKTSLRTTASPQLILPLLLIPILTLGVLVLGQEVTTCKACPGDPGDPCDILKGLKNETCAKNSVCYYYWHRDHDIRIIKCVPQSEVKEPICKSNKVEQEYWCDFDGCNHGSRTCNDGNLDGNIFLGKKPNATTARPSSSPPPDGGMTKVRANRATPIIPASLLLLLFSSASIIILFVSIPTSPV